MGRLAFCLATHFLSITFAGVAEREQHRGCAVESQPGIAERSARAAAQTTTAEQPQMDETILEDLEGMQFN